MSSRTTSVVLGMDVGASHTRAVLADERGQILGVGRAGSGNWEGVGLEGARQAYHIALDAALADAGLERIAIAASAYGLAGLDWPSDVGRLEPVIVSLGVPGPREMVNDVFLLLRAGTVDGVGLAAIAGSGAKGVGRNRDGQTAARDVLAHLRSCADVWGSCMKAILGDSQYRAEATRVDADCGSAFPLL